MDQSAPPSLAGWLLNTANSSTLLQIIATAGAVVAAMLLLRMVWRTGSEGADGALPLGLLNDVSSEAIFVFVKGVLHAQNRPAARLIGPDAETLKLADLPDRLDLERPELLADGLDELSREGITFERECRSRAETNLLVSGLPMGRKLVVRIQDVTAFRGAQRVAADDLMVARSDYAVTQRALLTLGTHVWRLDADGTLSWTNAGEDLARSREVAMLISHAREQRDLIVNGDPIRVSLPLTPGGPLRWFEIAMVDDGQGGTLVRARAIDEMVQTEQALSRFLETLTETFAHLPIGLAIFDRNRALGLFNPALCEHLGLDPVWLAARPSLRAFLERLREGRMVPEQPHFGDWRDQFMALERRAEGDEYDETWPLPSGRTLRVTGRAHPQGALAFLFEDVSQRLRVEQDFDSALTLRETAFARLNHPAVLFDAGGQILVRSAAQDAPEADEPVPQQPLTLDDQLALWRDQFGDDPIWHAVRRFVGAATHGRKREVHILTGADGQVWDVALTPLPDGASLVAFTPPPHVKGWGAPLPQTGADADAVSRPALKAVPDPPRAEPILERIVADARELTSAAGVRLELRPLPSGEVLPDRPNRVRALAGTLFVAALSEIAPGQALGLGLTLADGGRTLALHLTGLRPPLRTTDQEGDRHEALDHLALEAGAVLRRDGTFGVGSINCAIPLAGPAAGEATVVEEQSAGQTG
ncbi:MAG: PAS-domain containing protein [Pseudomonadota bacterium]